MSNLPKPRTRKRNHPELPKKYHPDNTNIYPSTNNGKTEDYRLFNNRLIRLKWFEPLECPQCLAKFFPIVRYKGKPNRGFPIYCSDACSHASSTDKTDKSIRLAIQRQKQQDRNHTPYRTPGAPRCPRPRGDGKPCLQIAGAGTDHFGYGPCADHGGNLPNTRIKYAREMIMELYPTYGTPIEIGPHEAVLQEIHRTAGIVEWLGTMIRELGRDPEDDPDNPQRPTARGRSVLHQVTSQGVDVSVWVKMYQTERAHLVKVASAAVTMGVAERQVQIAEEQGRLVALVINKALNDPRLALTNAQKAVQREVIRDAITTMSTQAIEVEAKPSISTNGAKAKARANKPPKP